MPEDENKPIQDIGWTLLGALAVCFLISWVANW